MGRQNMYYCCFTAGGKGHPFARIKLIGGAGGRYGAGGTSRVLLSLKVQRDPAPRQATPSPCGTPRF